VGYVVRSEHSYGPMVAAWCEAHLRTVPMVWQQYALARLLEHDGATNPGLGELTHRRALDSTARQNGKSLCVKALVGWWLTEFAAMRDEAQVVVLTANELRFATILAEQLFPVLLDRFDCVARWSYGRADITFADGSVLYVLAPTAACGHGLTVDLAVVDECWAVKPEAVDQGLDPARRARRSSLISMWSTAGTERSTLMLRWREQGLRQIDKATPGSLHMAEWSPPPGIDPMDRRAWRWGNPALGHTLDIDTLESEAEAPDRSAFLRASLNLWVATEAGWLPQGAWDECYGSPTMATQDRPGSTPGWLVGEVSQDGSRYVALSVTPDDENGAHVSVAFVVDDEPAFWRETDDLMRTFPALRLAVTPSLDVHLPERWRARTTVVGFKEIATWTALVRSAILDGRVHHDGSVALSEHVSRAVAVKTQGGLAISSHKSPGPVELARCLVWGVALATTPTTRRRPMIATSA